MKTSKLKTKNIGFLKKFLAIFLVMMLMLPGFLQVYAQATSQGEENFCIDWIENLPTNDEFLNEVKRLPQIDELNEFRKIPTGRRNKSNEIKYINDKKCYESIKKTVEKLKSKVKKRTAPAKALETDMGKGKKYSKYSDVPEKIRLAKAIYRWVAKNIHFSSGGFSMYDYQTSLDPQDAFFVFATRRAVCEGFSRLTQLMMNMADIPCVYLGSIMGRGENCGHAFNAVYLEDGSKQRRGWTLIDTTWGASSGFGHILDPLKNANELIFTASQKRQNKVSCVAGRFKNNRGNNLNKNQKNTTYTNIKNKVKKFVTIYLSKQNYIKNKKKCHLLQNKPLNLDIIQRYFPAFYYTGISFKDANRMIVRQSFHKIAGIDGISLEWSKKVNFPALDCSTHEGNGKIEISAWASLSELEKDNYYVPEYLIKYGLPIEIPCDARRLILRGDEIIDISGAVNLRYIDTTNSKKYDFDNGILYEKVGGKRGREVSKLCAANQSHGFLI